MPPPLNRDTLPTIGSSRRQGMRRFEVTCANPQCRHNAMLEFDALGMDDSVIFIEIPRCQRFRCTKCGARKIEVFPDWSHLNGHRGTGRAHAQ